MMATIVAWFSQYFAAYILPAILGWLARHIQEVIKDYMQAKKTAAVVQESKDAKTDPQKDQAAKDMANNY